MQFNLYAWTGDYNSFAAAAAGGAEVAMSAFQVGTTMYWIADARPSSTCPRWCSIPGDANLDGKVDVNDLTIVLANFGQTTA